MVRTRDAQPRMTILPRRLAFAAGLTVLAVCTTASAGAAGRVLPPPSFRPAAGWWMLTTGPTSRIAPETWVASDRGGDQEALFNLFLGLRRLTPHSIVIWASPKQEARRTRPIRSAACRYSSDGSAPTALGRASRQKTCNNVSSTSRFSHGISTSASTSAPSVRTRRRSRKHRPSSTGCSSPEPSPAARTGRL